MVNKQGRISQAEGDTRDGFDSVRGFIGAIALLPAVHGRDGISVTK